MNSLFISTEGILLSNRNGQAINMPNCFFFRVVYVAFFSKKLTTGKFFQINFPLQAYPDFIGSGFLRQVIAPCCFHNTFYRHLYVIVS